VKRTTIYVEENVWCEFSIKAIELGLTRTALLRRIISEWLEKNRQE